MSSLADTIRSTAAVSHKSSGAVVLDRFASSSRGNGNCVITSDSNAAAASAAGNHSHSVDESSYANVTGLSTAADDATYWKSKFYEVCELNRACEDDLVELKRNYDDKQENMLAYIKALENRIQATNNVEKSSSGPMRVKSSSSSSTDSSDLALNELRAKLAFYELFTGTTVKVNTGTSATFTVKNSVERLVTRFNVSVDSSEEGGARRGDIHFEPTGNVHLLPEFLQANLSMEAQHAPLLFGNVLQALFEERE